MGRRQEAHRVAEDLAKLPETHRPALAVLLIIIDDLPFEDIWRSWTEHGKEHASIQFWVHAKTPEKVRSSWVRRHLLSHSFRPTWGSVKLTQAMHYLLKESYSHSTQVRQWLIVPSSFIVDPVRFLLVCIGVMHSHSARGELYPTTSSNEQ